MSHLPKRTLYDVIAQRQRVLRGREETWWERFRDRLPSIDWFEAVFLIVMLIGAGVCLEIAVLLWRIIQMGGPA